MPHVITAGAGRKRSRSRSSEKLLTSADDSSLSTDLSPEREHQRTKSGFKKGTTASPSPSSSSSVVSVVDGSDAVKANHVQRSRRNADKKPTAVETHAVSSVEAKRDGHRKPLTGKKAATAASATSPLLPSTVETELTPEDASIQKVVTAILSDWRSGSALLTEDIIRLILRRVRPILMAQPMLVRVEAPVNVCGDIHGQITDLVEIFKAGGLPPESRYLFLGDYVDRGRYGCEVISVLLGLKVLYPKRIYVLRGNHETDSICRVYGFFDEVKRRFNVRLFKEFTDVFNCLPIAALIEDIALCMHGGLSPELHHLRQIEQVCRPLVVPDEGLACDLLWSDPEEGVRGWQPSERGVSFIFGEEVVRRLCDALKIDIILRAHQVVDEGYSFFAGRRLVTIFSASNYCGEFTNSGAMMVMDENCMCSFQIFKPEY